MASLLMNENSLALQLQNQMKSSHHLLRKLIIWIVLFVIIAIFYMMTNYPDRNHPFHHDDDGQHYLLKELTKRHMRKKKLPHIFGNVHALLPSLMVKPLKNVSRSHTVQQMNEEKLKKLFKKIASTTIKQLYLYLGNQDSSAAIDSNDTIDRSPLEPVNNLSNFHFKSNDQLYRISPTFMVYSREAQYYKAIFVRHPFVRVVSAFKDKAERQPKEEQYFYELYWNPLLNKLHGKERDPSIRVTFREFVEELLLPNDPYQYDEHWAPVWTRCEPCLVHYDFIGKLETSEEDFRNFKSRVNDKLINVTVWENLNEKFSPSMKNNVSSLMLEKCQRQRLKYAETIHYLSQLPPKSLIELYKIYYLDFELFGYTIDELFELITN
ncbi:chondroitin 4-sulfotransferase-like protein [Euroglyphus maynei]|uniref:Carbohydrate sulfotransferase n=1 Tax=Euroglyphus maynei TaxID=6958 RepID=A0A1Y3BLH3_EURMA|nr:chondroitin 4-sulfotransferase-like protein [Euroglyphus maynei]